MAIATFFKYTNLLGWFFFSIGIVYNKHIWHTYNITIKNWVTLNFTVNGQASAELSCK